MASGDDLDFNDIVMADERFQKEGHEAGIEAGKVSGGNEGRRLGCIQGSQMGSEIGFYYGFVSSYKTTIDETDDKNRRKIKAMNTLLELIDSFPKQNPQDDTMQDCLAKIRAKFKQISSMLNIVTSHGEASSSDKGISF